MNLLSFKFVISNRAKGECEKSGGICDIYRNIMFIKRTFYTGCVRFPDPSHSFGMTMNVYPPYPDPGPE